MSGSQKFSLRSREDARKLAKSFAIAVAGFALAELAALLSRADVPDQWLAAASLATFAVNTLRLWLTDTRAIVPFWLAAILLLPPTCGAGERSPIQAPPSLPAPQTITILRSAWFGPYRVRGREIPVQEVAPGIYREIPPRVPRWLDPLGVWAR